MTVRDLTDKTIPRFYMENGKVVQSFEPGAETEFDPKSWQRFTRGSLVVHAVQIPRPFKVGADVCTDGYLVYDGKLYAISTRTFSRDYRPLMPASEATWSSSR